MNVTRMLCTLGLLGCLLLLAAPARAGSQGFLWQVQGQDCTVWLLGSIHVADAGLYPLRREIERAWKRSEVLAVEVDVTAPPDQEALELLQDAAYPPGQSLRDDISPQTLAELRGQGLDLQPFLHMRPWFAIMAAAQNRLAELGVDSRYGVDVHFIRRAHEQGREIAELEGMAMQLRDMDALAGSDPEGFVRYMLKDLDRLEQDLDLFLAAWKAGDAERMEDRLFQELRQDPASRPFYEQLFFARNERMAETVEGYLASGRDHLVIVGAGHLLGERSIVDLLERRGYAVERL